MSFFKDLLGSSQRRDISNASAQATAIMDQGRTRALAAFQGAAPQAESQINAGYDTARGDIGSAVTSAKGSLNRGYDTARGDIGTNYGNAKGTYEDYLGRSTRTLNPMIAAGDTARGMYGDALGMNGAAARQSFYDNNVTGNTTFNYADDLAAKQLQQKLNAAGVTGGRAGSMMVRQGAQRVEDRTNQYLDRLKGVSDQGGQYRSQLAGYEQNTGQNIAGLQARQGDQLAGLETSRGTALAGMDQWGGSQNANLATGRGRDLSNLTMGNAGQVAGVESNYAGNMAGNAINLGTATANARTAGINNMLQLAGLALGASGFQGFSGFGGGRQKVMPSTYNPNWPAQTQRA